MKWILFAVIFWVPVIIALIMKIAEITVRKIDKITCYFLFPRLIRKPRRKKFKEMTDMETAEMAT